MGYIPVLVNLAHRLLINCSTWHIFPKMSPKCHSYSGASVPFSRIHDTPYCNIKATKREDRPSSCLWWPGWCMGENVFLEPGATALTCVPHSYLARVTRHRPETRPCQPPRPVGNQWENVETTDTVDKRKLVLPTFCTLFKFRIIEEWGNHSDPPRP